MAFTKFSKYLIILLLITITIIHSLSEIYLILKTILFFTSKDKLSFDMIINYILIKFFLVILVNFPDCICYLFWKEKRKNTK